MFLRRKINRSEIAFKLDKNRPRLISLFLRQILPGRNLRSERRSGTHARICLGRYYGALTIIFFFFFWGGGSSFSRHSPFMTTAHQNILNCMFSKWVFVFGVWTKRGLGHPSSISWEVMSSGNCQLNSRTAYGQ